MHTPNPKIVKTTALRRLASEGGTKFRGGKGGKGGLSCSILKRRERFTNTKTIHGQSYKPQSSTPQYRKISSPLSLSLYLFLCLVLSFSYSRSFSLSVRLVRMHTERLCYRNVGRVTGTEDKSIGCLTKYSGLSHGVFRPFTLYLRRQS